MYTAVWVGAFPKLPLLAAPSQQEALEGHRQHSVHILPGGGGTGCAQNRVKCQVKGSATPDLALSRTGTIHASLFVPDNHYSGRWVGGSVSDPDDDGM